MLSHKKTHCYIHDFGNEWGLFIDPEKLQYTLYTNEELIMRKKYYPKKHEIFLQNIDEEYDYYTKNYIGANIEEHIEDNISKTLIVNTCKICIINLTSIICFTMFLTTVTILMY
jgi:hypothetical protein